MAASRGCLNEEAVSQAVGEFIGKFAVRMPLELLEIDFDPNDVHMTLASLDTFLGLLATGILQDRTDDLRLALTIVCFAPLSLTIVGTALRIWTDREG